MTDTLATEKNETKASNKRYTARDLINHHILFPEKPITNDDIENLILGVPAVSIDLSNFENNN